MVEYGFPLGHGPRGSYILPHGRGATVPGAEDREGEARSGPAGPLVSIEWTESTKDATSKPLTTSLSIETLLLDRGRLAQTFYSSFRIRDRTASRRNGPPQGIESLRDHL